MAHITHEPSAHRSLAGLLTAPFIALFHAMIHLAEIDPRYKELQQLSALTDAQLAARGLRRENIATHVLRGRVLM